MIATLAKPIPDSNLILDIIIDYDGDYYADDEPAFFLSNPRYAWIYNSETATSRFPALIEGAMNDANLRSTMDWDLIKNDDKTNDLLRHYQKLGSFRKNHLAIGAGVHKSITKKPYVFERTYTKGAYKDDVVIGLDLPMGKKEIKVGSVFQNGEKVNDAYSGSTVKVINGKVTLNTPYSIVLLEKK